MKVYLNPKHKWGIVYENDNGKKHYIAIPPTDGNRIDFITYDKIIVGYNYGVKGVFVFIENGIPRLVNNLE